MNESSIAMNTLICVTKEVNSRPESKTYSDLYDHLYANYDINMRNRCATLFEYFQSNKNIKPHFDYEVYVSYNEDPDHNDAIENLIKQKFLKVANELFEAKDSDWAISSDCRPEIKSEKINGKMQKVQKYKISFHFVLWTRYCTFDAFSQWIKGNLEPFTNAKLHGVDIKIYTSGWRKFRVPMTRKSVKSFTSCLKPLNYTEKDEFHKHFVSYLKDAEEWKVPSEVYEMAHEHSANTERNRIADKIQKTNQNASMEIQAIIDTYTIVGNPKKGFAEFKDCMFYDVKECECEQTHKHNHNYLIHNTVLNTLKIKCHSDKCSLFQRILYKEIAPTRHFDLKYIRNIPIPLHMTDNYQQVKKYFEQFFIFVRDTNSFYRVAYEYSEKYKYYEKLLKPVSIQGFKQDMFYQEYASSETTNEDEEEIDMKIEQKNFFKMYDRDPYKNSYLGLSFQPYGVHTDCHKINNGDYNLFDGFDYTRQLSYMQKLNLFNTTVHEERFKFLLKHIRHYICGLVNAGQEGDQRKIELANKSYTYLMSFFANIIQAPTIVPQIILIFYSKTHGTGKSGFTKFLSAVIGQGLCYFGSYEQIMEKHSQAHVGKLLNIIEEVDKRSSKMYHNRMKDFSQRERAVYNEKNKPQYDIKTYVRYIKTTNYRDGVWFDHEDRRYVLYTFDRIDNISYVNEWLAALEDPQVIYLFGQYLSKFEIPYNFVDWERERPLTDDYFDMRCEDPITQFLTDFVQLQSISLENLNPSAYFPVEGTDYNRMAVAKEDFYNLFTKFYDDNNCMNRNYKNKRKFLNHIKNNYAAEITVRKFKVSRRDFYDIDLIKLSRRLLDTEYDSSTHFNEQQ